MYELPHELPKDLRLGILKNESVLQKNCKMMHRNNLVPIGLKIICEGLSMFRCFNIFILHPIQTKVVVNVNLNFDLNTPQTFSRQILQLRKVFRAIKTFYINMENYNAPRFFH